MTERLPTTFTDAEKRQAHGLDPDADVDASKLRFTEDQRDQLFKLQQESFRAKGKRGQLRVPWSSLPIGKVLKIFSDEMDEVVAEKKRAEAKLPPVRVRRGPRGAMMDSVVAQWTSARPDLASRLGRARELVGNIQAAREGSDGTKTFFIMGSRGVPYTVKVLGSGESECDCEDGMTLGHSHCKHQLAVLIRLAVPPHRPLDPKIFEGRIRRWAERPGRDHEWLGKNGLFAIQTLLGEIDRLRAPG